MRPCLDWIMFRLGYVRLTVAEEIAVRSLRIGLLSGRHDALTGSFEITAFAAVILDEDCDQGDKTLH
jgi:hypothetical protein